MHFKRGQIGETATWIVATIAILIITFVFIYASSFISVGKSLEGTSFGIKVDEGKGIIGTQQMLFAMLNYKELPDASPIKDNIISGEYNLVTIPLGPRLTEFSDSGVNCNFFILENLVAQRNSGVIGETKLGEVSVSLTDEKKARLKC
ncbi:hypothetical protein AUJ84_00915 [Candidatus Pacearchaeota archaeon CG1_02_32_132]|nr:MAG: hypothetical protein AUJ84_00915 [Candidatus Pacearchaeota archaeon CG1_02_32_132]